MHRPTFLVILVVATFLVAGRTENAVEQKGLDFAMTTEKRIYNVGEPIRVTFIWKNVTDKRLVIVNWRGPMGGVTLIGDEPERTFDFAVLYDGEELLPYRGEFVCGPTSALNLEPKGTLTREYEISDAYSFTRPGRYVLRTVYMGFPRNDRVPEHWRGKIVHPDVEVRVQE